MPGLMRGMARTAAIAGTATAVSGRVQRRQAEKFAGRDAQIYATQDAAYQEVTAQAPPPPPTDDVFSQLERLGNLRAQGILTQDEFDAQKAKLLGG